MMTRSIHECWHVRTNKCVRTNICKKLVFVVSIRNKNICERILTQFTGLLRTNTVAVKRVLLAERTGLGKWVLISLRKNGSVILQAPPNLHPIVLEGLVRTKTFLGVVYSVSNPESSLSSEVRNYDHHRWDTNKEMRETNTPCVPFDVLLVYHWERCEKVDHVRHRGLKEWSPIDFLLAHILHVSFGDCRPHVASQLTRRKDMEVLHNFAQPLIIHMPIFWYLVDHPKTCSFVGLIKPCHLLTGLFWDAVDSFAGLFDWFYYLLTGESTSKADKFDNFCRQKS